MRACGVGGIGRKAHILVLLSGAAALAACSSAQNVGSQETSPTLMNRLSGYFGGSKEAAPKPAPTAPTAPPVAATVDCPGVEIRAGAGTFNVATAKKGEATAGDLKYQVSFNELARECIVTDGNLTIKVGVQGRVIIGPQGGPGSVEVPLRYAVVKEGPEPKTITTKFKKVPVTVPPSEVNVPWLDVDDSMVFPLPATTELAAYVIYVGFDDAGDKSGKPAPKSAKRPAKTQ
jgi:hypothetical protein